MTYYELKYWRHVTFWKKLPGWRFRIKNLQRLGFWIKLLRVENGIKSFTNCHIPNLNSSNVTDFGTKYYNALDFETKDLQLFVNYSWCDKFWEKTFKTVWFFGPKLYKCQNSIQHFHSVWVLEPIYTQRFRFRINTTTRREIFKKIFTSMFHFESKI